MSIRRMTSHEIPFQKTSGIRAISNKQKNSLSISISNHESSVYGYLMMQRALSSLPTHNTTCSSDSVMPPPSPFIFITRRLQTWSHIQYKKQAYIKKMLTCCLHEFCMIQNAQHTQLGQQFLLASYCAPIFGQWHATCISFLAPNGSGSYSICVFNGDILSIPKNQSKEAV